MQAIRNALKNLETNDGSHAGLLLQRYLQESVAEPNGSNRERHKEARKKNFDAVQKALPKTLDVYKQAYTRWKISLPNATTKSFKVQGRMILGLGSESPLETGLRLHHTYGTPVIPGCALKGLACHYCDQAWGKNDNRFARGGDYFQVIFGNTNQKGCIHFYDAMIVPDSLSKSLVLDVMTVHHSQYYDKGKVAPTDFDSPIPITFLSIQGKFTIAIECTEKSENAKNWENLAMALIQEACRKWGIGGKTSSGYGRL